MKTNQIIYTAFFVALGIVLPQAIHMLGGQGTGAVFLPMHIPVIVGAIILGPLSGVLIGVLSVSIGFLLGMPTMPMAVFMLLELSTYGLIAGLLGKKVNTYITLIVAMFSGRVVSIIAMRFAISVLGIKLPPIFGTVALFSIGIPGIIIQLIIVPILVMAVRRYHGSDVITG